MLHGYALGKVACCRECAESELLCYPKPYKPRQVGKTPKHLSM